MAIGSEFSDILDAQAPCPQNYVCVECSLCIHDVVHVGVCSDSGPFLKVVENISMI